MFNDCQKHFKILLIAAIVAVSAFSINQAGQAYANWVNVAQVMAQRDAAVAQTQQVVQEANQKLAQLQGALQQAQKGAGS